MRYDTPIYFQRITPGAYDPNTGNYGPDETAEVLRYASVTDTGEQTLLLVYGGIKQGSLTIRLQNRYDAAFDRIRIGDKFYKVDLSRKLRVKQNFVVSEVP